MTRVGGARRRGGAQRPVSLRLHIENDPESPVEAVTPEAFARAARRRPALARRLRVTYGADPDALEAALRPAEVLIASRFPAHDLAWRAPNLRWIQSTSAGVEKLIPLLPSGVTLTNASGVHPPKGGEYALTALLMLNHDVLHFATRQRERRWDPRFTTRLAGKTVVVVGMGRIGAEVARLGRRFGLRVLGVRRSARPHRYVDEMYGPHELKRVFPRADFVVVTLPLTAATRGLIGRPELARLRSHVGLVNLGRGAVMDYEALAERLERGELGGAVLDVFPEEPLPPTSRLWSTPNLLISPHSAVDDAAEYVPRCLDIFFDNLRRYLAGRPLRNRVDPSLGY